MFSKIVLQIYILFANPANIFPHFIYRQPLRLRDATRNVHRAFADRLDRFFNFLCV